MSRTLYVIRDLDDGNPATAHVELVLDATGQPTEYFFVYLHEATRMTPGKVVQAIAWLQDRSGCRYAFTAEVAP